MNDSQIVGVSVRAWIALLLAVTLTALVIINPDMFKDAFVSTSALAFGFYFGQKTQQEKQL